ncbi:MAG TPA: diaminopimelate decarboxylase [Candidatus Limnocylindrales bacterium]|nr:diaminopimelate decarboxylase [Candidatus Limnocylindrales bacterium]
MPKRRDQESHDPIFYTPDFSYRRDAIFCEGVSLAAIAGRAGTPSYVYSRSAFASAYRRFRRAFHGVPHSICYAVKANSNLAVLRAFARMGSSFDIVSAGELFRLRRIGVPGERIVFSGVGKTREEIREALRARILLFNVESAAELEMLASEAARVGRSAPAAIRVNPDIEAGGHPHIATGHHRHKFGIDWPEARRLYLLHKQSLWIDWRGISGHIGSQITKITPFRGAAARLARYCRELARAGIRLRYLDIGGGLGIRYTNENPPSIEEYAAGLPQSIRALGCHLLFEPGRALIGQAGVLLMRVLYIKRGRGKTFIVVDAAMNDLIRPALYGAAHPITPVTRPRANAKISNVDIVGPICESGDLFLRDWPMPEVQPGDLLVIWGAGAYGFAESSNYNSRPRAAEILVEGSRFRVVRRRESLADLIRGERLT